MKKNRWTALAGALCGVMLCVSACGYRFEGGGYLDDNIVRVAVEMFENRSSESSAGILFTNELIREIQKTSDTRVVDEEEAEAVIRAVVKSITFSALSRTSSETVYERRVSATVDLKLVSSSGELLWSIKDFFFDDSYQVSGSAAEDDSNRSAALTTIAERSAELLVGKMLTNF